MIDPGQALATLPQGLRDPLLVEYQSITHNFAEHRWGPSELSGGRFCEVIYTVLAGYAAGEYANKPSKPSDFVSACRKLEQHTHVPRSFQILIPRILPALYEIRNNRGVGHVGGDVDPNQMDATAVLSMSSWIMAELVRIFHKLDTSRAQQVVDALVERPMPLIWSGDNTKVVLNRDFTLRSQILILLASSGGPVPIATLQKWLKYGNKAYLRKLVAEMDEERSVHLASSGVVHLLPPGAQTVSDLLTGK